MTFKNNSFSLLIAAAIFLAPINLFIKWGESQAYVGGIFTDYLVQKFWIGEIPVILAVVLWLWQKNRGLKGKILPFLKKNAVWLAVLAVLGIRQYFSPLPFVSLWYFVKLIELILFGWCLHDLWPKLHSGLIRYALLLTVLFQGGVATLQFFRQQPLFEYQILGETQLTGSINIARGIFKTGEMILPYGTTAHPNILAGVMVIFGILWLKLRSQYLKKFSWKELAVVGIISWVLFMTQSVSALLAFLIFLFLQHFPIFKKYIFSAALIFIILAPAVLMLLPTQLQTESVLRRIFLNAHSASVITQQPILGNGLNMFTTTLENSSGSNFSQFIRFIQPVHNVLLLWLAETGLLGIVFLWVGLNKLRISKHSEWLLILAPLISLDHYLLTQWVGGIILVLVFMNGFTQQNQKEN